MSQWPHNTHITSRMLSVFSTVLYHSFSQVYLR